jgi:phosphoribosyl 1,2-cyclic phosphate phosphodiesterase
MTMQIKLLGTGSAEGWPGLFCSCDVCQRSRQVRGKNLRSRSAALIDGVVKVDFPPDTLHHILTQNLDLTRLQFLLFTHGHDDHCAAYELQYLSWMFVPEPIAQDLSVLAPPTVIDKIRATVEAGKLPLDLQCVEPWETVLCGSYLITAVQAHHDPDQVCLNYLISNGNRTLLYATDTGVYDEPAWRFLDGRKIDGAVIEASKGPIEGGYDGHLSIPDVIRMRERLVKMGCLRSDATVVTTHHSHLGGLMHEEIEAMLRPHGILAGYDGMEFTI